MHEVEAPSVPSPRETRRYLLDGAYTIALMTLAVLTGYGVLAPSARAKPAPPVASVGAVLALGPGALDAPLETVPRSDAPAAPAVAVPPAPREVAKPSPAPVVSTRAT